MLVAQGKDNLHGTGVELAKAIIAQKLVLVSGVSALQMLVNGGYDATKWCPDGYSIYREVVEAVYSAAMTYLMTAGIQVEDCLGAF